MAAVDFVRISMLAHGEKFWYMGVRSREVEIHREIVSYNHLPDGGSPRSAAKITILGI